MNKLVATTLRGHLGIEPRRFLKHSLEHHLIQVFRHNATNCVIDVGANTGQYGRMLRNIGYKGRIVSFEPLEAAFAALQACRPHDRNWLKFRSALGDEEGTRPINVTRSSDLSSFLTAKPGSVDWEADAGLNVDRVENVPIVRLDSVFERCIRGLPEPRIHLKLDTQGWDLEVIRGGTESLPRISTMQSEISLQPLYEGMTSWRDALSVLESKGFCITELVPVGVDRRLRVIEFDAVMTRDGTTSDSAAPQLRPSPAAS